MNPQEQLKKEYWSKASDPETLFLLDAEDAISFVRRGQELGLHFVGIEGFRVTSAGAYQPMQEASNDISDYAGSNFVQDTVLFIRSQNSDLKYQVVFALA